MTTPNEAFWAVGECRIREEGARPYFGVAISINGAVIYVEPESAKHIASMLLLTAEKVQKEVEREEADRKTKEAAHG